MLRYFSKHKHEKPNFERYSGKTYVQPMRWPFKTWLRLLLNPWAGKAFFESVISMLSFMAHADGPVTERELRVFMEILEKEFNLMPDEIEKARNVLFKNKNIKKTFDQIATQFFRNFRRSPATLENALDVLLAMAYEDNHLTLSEQDLIIKAAQIFHIGGKDLDRLIKRYHKNVTTVEEPKAETKEKRQQSFYKEEFRNTGAQKEQTKQQSNEQFRFQREERNQESKQEEKPKKDMFGTWWIALEIDPKATEEEVKKQYRKLVKKYHPDSQPPGVPEEMKRASTKRFIEIQKAYDQFCILNQ